MMNRGITLMILFASITNFLSCAANYRYLTDEYKVKKQEAIVKKYPILLVAAKTSAPNSAGGVDVKIIYENISDKPYKYVKFHVYPYNAVGDRVKCSIRHKSAAVLNVTGPVNPGKYVDDIIYECVWYNSTIVSVDVSAVEIIFMDGGKKTLDKKAVDLATVRINEQDYPFLQD